MKALLTHGLYLSIMSLLFGIFPNTSSAATVTLHNVWLYSYTDEPGNQDYVTHPIGSSGNAPLSYAFYQVEFSGSVISEGWLPQNGNVTFPRNAGSYTFLWLLARANTLPMDMK